ncbi:MAG: sugar ABC transporter permease [Deltaproteobacteria bacterium]
MTDRNGTGAAAHRPRLADSETWLGRLMIAPAVLYIAALIGVPLLLAILYSVSDVSTGDPSLDWAGLRNFSAALADPVFRTAVRNTCVFTFVSMALVLVLSKILALALMADFRGKWLARFLIMLPWTAPIALGTIGWLWILDSVFSPIDWAFRHWQLLGFPGALLGPNPNLYWLGVPGLAMGSVIAVHVWRMLPLATVIVLGGLSSIPKDLLEAADIDGAGFWRRTFQVVIPLVLPIMTIATLFGIVFTFTDMAVVYVLTRGGPVQSTQVIATWTFFKGIEGGDLAQGAAISLFLVPVLAGVAILMLRLARRTEVT